MPDSHNRPTVIRNEERAMLKLCNGTHPNIISVIKLGLFQHLSHFFFIDMELCDLSLREYLYPNANTNYSAIGLPPFLKDLPQSSKATHIWNIMKQISAGVEFIHSEGEVHRDLKPGNSETTSSFD
jgi:serine/threonine protein kinase